MNKTKEVLKNIYNGEPRLKNIRRNIFCLHNKKGKECIDFIEKVAISCASIAHICRNKNLKIGELPFEDITAEKVKEKMISNNINGKLFVDLYTRMLPPIWDKPHYEQIPIFLKIHNKLQQVLNVTGLPSSFECIKNINIIPHFVLHFPKNSIINENKTIDWIYVKSGPMPHHENYRKGEDGIEHLTVAKDNSRFSLDYSWGYIDENFNIFEDNFSLVDSDGNYLEPKKILLPTNVVEHHKKNTFINRIRTLILNTHIWLYLNEKSLVDNHSPTTDLGKINYIISGLEKHKTSNTIKNKSILFEVGKNIERPLYSSKEGRGVCSSPRPHWRQAHYRLQKIGRKKRQTKLIWIAPIYVNNKQIAIEDE